MYRKASFNALAAQLMDLSDDEQLALVDNPGKLKELAAAMVIETVQNNFFFPVSDKDAPERLLTTVPKWRKLAADLGHTGPILWRVKSGFTLKTHAPKAGPCYQGYSYLQDWNLQNDEATQDCVVFWIPRLLKDSVSKTVDEQMALGKQVRTTYDLPGHHLTSYGSAALLSGLVLAHFKRSGERTPLNALYARSDTLRVVGGRLVVGGFDEAGLYCDDWSDGERFDDLGFFPVGMEMGV